MSRNRRNKISSRKSVVLVVDGESEIWYIQQLKKYESEQIHFTLKPNLPKGKSLVDMYNKVKELEQNEEFEKIFWIIDFDVIIRETKKAKKGTKTRLDEFKQYYKSIDKNKVTTIINNPCLEYWFLQHFAETSKYFSKCADVEKDLKKHIKDYKKEEKFYNTCNCRKGIYLLLKPNLNTAIANSKKIKSFDFGKVDVKDYEIGLAEMYMLFKELGIK
jgi:hypothetical protein